jgi:hypothetical protein
MTTNNSWNSQDPVQVAKGGTGVNTTTAYGVLAGGTTATGAFQNCGAGTAGQVLTSNGAGVLPSFQAASSGAMVLLHTIEFDNTAFIYDLTPYVTGYNTYKFITSAAENISPSAVHSISLQFSSDGGTTWITTGYSTLFFYAGGTGFNQFSPSTSMIPLCVLNGTVNNLCSSENLLTGYGGNKGATVNGSWIVGNSSSGISTQMGGGDLFGNPLTLNGLRLNNEQSTNFISGKFSIYGITT